MYNRLETFRQGVDSGAFPKKFPNLNFNVVKGPNFIENYGNARALQKKMKESLRGKGTIGEANMKVEGLKLDAKSWEELDALLKDIGRELIQTGVLGLTSIGLAAATAKPAVRFIALSVALKLGTITVAKYKTFFSTGEAAAKALNFLKWYERGDTVSDAIHLISEGRKWRGVGEG